MGKLTEQELGLTSRYGAQEEERELGGMAAFWVPKSHAPTWSSFLEAIG